jgi:hypothetical protein
MGKLEFFVHTVVHQSTLCCVACNELECQKEVVVTYWEMLPVNSSKKFWMTDFQHHIWTWDFPKWKRLCQSMDGVCSCFDRTDSEVMSDIVLYELHKFHRPSVCLCHVCNGFPKFWNATVILFKPIPLSVCSSKMNNLSRNVCGFFENLTSKIIFHWSLIKINSALQQTTLHLQYRFAEYYL